MSEFQTYKNDLTKSRVVETDIGQALANLAKGDILVHIERFAFTANNVTYGAAGNTIGYWKFFPPRIMPAMNGAACQFGVSLKSQLQRSMV